QGNTRDTRGPRTYKYACDSLTFWGKDGASRLSGTGLSINYRMLRLDSIGLDENLCPDFRPLKRERSATFNAVRETKNIDLIRNTNCIKAAKNRNFPGKS